MKKRLLVLLTSVLLVGSMTNTCYAETDEMIDLTFMGWQPF